MNLKRRTKSMDMQRILQQARKMQKEMEKKQAALEETLFEITSAGRN